MMQRLYITVHVQAHVYYTCMYDSLLACFLIPRPAGTGMGMTVLRKLAEKSLYADLLCCDLIYPPHDPAGSSHPASLPQIN